MDNLVETYLISALSPANYEKIKAQLEAEPV
jgi:hypothetical protein